MHRARMFNRAPNMFTADGARDVDEEDNLSSVEHEPPEPSPRLSYSTSAAAPTRDLAFLALAPPPRPIFVESLRNSLKLPEVEISVRQASFMEEPDDEEPLSAEARCAPPHVTSRRST